LSTASASKCRYSGWLSVSGRGLSHFIQVIFFLRMDAVDLDQKILDCRARCGRANGSAPCTAPWLESSIDDRVSAGLQQITDRNRRVREEGRASFGERDPGLRWRHGNGHAGVALPNIP